MSTWQTISGERLDLIPEARVIQEDDLYAVIAFRVEKEWIARNIHFLVALSAFKPTSNGHPAL